MARMRKSPLRTLLKPSEVASLLGVSPKTVYTWCRLEMIQGVKIGKILRIRRNSLWKLLNDTKRLSSADRRESESHSGKEDG